MKGIRTPITELVYRGPTPDIGDLWCHREEFGVIMSVWEPSDEERQLIAEGGNIVLWIHTEPIPPVALSVWNDDDAKPVGEFQFKVIPELDDKERKP